MSAAISLEPAASQPNSKLAKWESVLSIPMVLLSVTWIVLITIYVLEQPGKPGRIPTGYGLLVIWLMFIVDYLVRLFLAERKWAFMRASVLDLSSVIVPILRPFHLLTYLRAIPYFRRTSAGALRARLGVWGLCFAVIFVYTIALSVFEVERNAPGGNIDSLGNSIWWALVTITTVGYGDFTPVTIPGRIFAVVLMIGGIAIVGTTSAIVISVLNERLQRLAKHHGSGDATQITPPSRGQD